MECLHWGNVRNGVRAKVRPTEGVNIRLWSCDSGDGNNASVNDDDVEGCDRH